MYDFISDFAPHLTRKLVAEAFQLKSRAELDELFGDLELPEL
jgi:LysR family cys regulon transcriptional activator